MSSQQRGDLLRKIKVLVIDDSATVREVLTRALSKDREIEVVGSAIDPLFAVKRIKEQKPDVITLDIEMPRMDGLTFLKKLMSSYPIPVIMVSSWTKRGGSATLKALELGAIDFVEKPSVSVASGLNSLAEEIIQKVKMAARVDPLKLRSMAQMSKSTVELPADKQPVKLLQKTTDRLIAIGASTGGTTAVRSVLLKMPYDMLPIIVVLHMPAGFTKSYAQGLNSSCRMQVKEAEDGEAVLRGYAYIAPGGKHLLLGRSGAQYVIRLNEEPPYNRHRPSVDKTLLSVAQAAGENAAGIILTGMGNDGAAGLKALRDSGAWTAVQDEKTSVVFGMPKQALLMGAANEVLPLPDIPAALLRWSQGTRD